MKKLMKTRKLSKILTAGYGPLVWKHCHRQRAVNPSRNINALYRFSEYSEQKWAQIWSNVAHIQTDCIVLADYDISCLNNEWKCTNSSQCIHITQLCDGIIDCDNKEDESSPGRSCSKCKFCHQSAIPKWFL